MHCNALSQHPGTTRALEIRRQGARRERLLEGISGCTELVELPPGGAEATLRFLTPGSPRANILNRFRSIDRESRDTEFRQAPHCSVRRRLRGEKPSETLKQLEEKLDAAQ